MKSHCEKLLERAIAAMVAALEVYNKPAFLYREETFSILAVNGWELLLKAKWLKEHDDDISSLHVMTSGEPDGAGSETKKSRSGNPLTHSADLLAKN